MALGPRSHGNLPPGTCDSLALPCPVDTRPQRRGQCPAGASPSVGECRRARSDPRVLPAACEEAGEPTLIAGPLPRRPQRGAGHSGVGAGLHVLGCVGMLLEPGLGGGALPPCLPHKPRGRGLEHEHPGVCANTSVPMDLERHAEGARGGTPSPGAPEGLETAVVWGDRAVP